MSTKSTTTQNSTIGIVPTMPWRVAEVHPLEEYKLKVRFIDGIEGFVFMKNLITGKNAGVFSALKDKNIFNKVFIEHGAVTWPGELDIAPDTMYDEIKKNGECILS